VALGRRQEHDLSSDLRFYDPMSGTVSFDGVNLATPIPARYAAKSRWCAGRGGVRASVRDNIRFGGLARATRDRAAAEAGCRRIHSAHAGG